VTRVANGLTTRTTFCMESRMHGAGCPPQAQREE
jgi:hypothetical protein